MKQQQVVSSHSYRRITTGKHKEDYDEKEKEENVQFLQVASGIQRHQGVKMLSKEMFWSLQNQRKVL